MLLKAETNAQPLMERKIEELCFSMVKDFFFFAILCIEYHNFVRPQRKETHSSSQDPIHSIHEKVRLLLLLYQCH